MDEMTQPQVGETANQPDITYSEETHESAPNVQNGAADEPFLTVRYNKQDKPLTREEAAVYAQKGMNYDKLSEKLKTADEQLKMLGVQQGKDGQDVQAQISAQLETFTAAHPDIDPATLPETVLNAWKSGVPLGEAYDAHRMSELDTRARELERAAKALAANENNASASMGSAGSMGAAHAQPLTDDAILAMSQAELDRNHARIWAYLTGQKG